jgi:HlyD family secretion protein
MKKSRLFPAAAVLLCVLLFCVRGARAQEAAVNVSRLQQKTVAEGGTFIGNVVAMQHSIVGSAVAGRVETVHVEEGDAIDMLPGDDGSASAVGSPLVQLRERTASLEVAASAAELRLREKELEELENGARPEEITRALARKQSAEAVLQFAASKLARTQKLMEQGLGATEEELDEALSAKLAAEQQTVEARAAWEEVTSGPRPETIAQAQARLDMATERLRLLEDIQTKYTIRTPFRGFVIKKYVEVGAWVSQGDPVAEVVRLDVIDVRASVPADSISAVRPEMPVRITVDNLPGEVLSGTVHRIVPQADIRARTFPVLVRLQNPQRDGAYLLMPGMVAKVTIAVGKPQPALLAPKDALIWNGQNVTLVVADRQSPEAPPVARIVPVQLGVVEGSLFQVIDPTQSLSEGQSVVTVGNERLRPGQPLKILK